MLKIIGGIMVLSSCTLIGFLRSARLKSRCSNLERIVFGLRLMENEITSGRTRIDKLLEKVGAMSGLAFDPSGENAEVSFMSGVDEDTLKNSDMVIISSFSKTLGKTDSEAQLRNLKNTLKSLEAMESEACAEYEKYGKLYRNMGVLVGLMAVILLL